jgi:hypothetical protein
MAQIRPKIYLAQAAWRLVKEFAGIYNIKHINVISQMDTDLIIDELFKTLLPAYPYKRTQHESHDGRRLQRDKDRKLFKNMIRPAIYAVKDFKHPARYWQKGVHKTNDRSLILEGVSFIFASHLEHKQDSVVWTSYDRNIRNELELAYYNKYHHSVCKIMASTARSFIDDPFLRTLVYEGVAGSMPLELLPRLDIESMPNELKNELWIDILHNAVAQQYSASISHEKLLRSSIFAVLANHKRRQEVYKNLVKINKSGKYRCACGKLVTSRSERSHILSNTHSTNILRDMNMTTLEAWYKVSGTVPHGFFRDDQGQWKHIIPADSKRTIHHIIKHNDGVNLCDYISRSPDGRGNARPIN